MQVSWSEAIQQHLCGVPTRDIGLKGVGASDGSLARDLATIIFWIADIKARAAREPGSSG
jgi:hypothetical protein